MESLSEFLNVLDVAERAHEQGAHPMSHEQPAAFDHAAPQASEPEDLEDASDSSGYAEPAHGRDNGKRRCGSRTVRKEREKAAKEM